MDESQDSVTSLYTYENLQNITDLSDKVTGLGLAQWINTNQIL